MENFAVCIDKVLDKVYNNICRKHTDENKSRGINMKKITLSLVTLISVLVMAFSFAACGAGGTYKFDSLSVGVGSLSKTYSVGEEYLGRKLEAGDYTLVLKGDNTCTIKLGENESEKTGTWKEEDGKITFDVSGVTIGKATRDGSKITFDYGGLKITLKK